MAARENQTKFVENMKLPGSKKINLKVEKKQCLSFLHTVHVTVTSSKNGGGKIHQL